MRMTKIFVSEPFQNAHESQDVAPFALVLQHNLAQETNGWHAVVEQFVVEFLQ